MPQATLERSQHSASKSRSIARSSETNLALFKILNLADRKIFEISIPIPFQFHRSAIHGRIKACANLEELFIAAV
jgi:hypothetical protein